MPMIPGFLYSSHAALLFAMLAMPLVSHAEIIAIPPGSVTASSEIGGSFNRQDDFIEKSNGVGPWM